MHGIDTTPARTPAPLTVSDWLTEHIDSLRNLDAYTPHKYRQYRAEVVEFLGEDKALADVTAVDVADWVAWLQENGGRRGDGNAPKTISNKHGYFAGAMRAAVRAGKVPVNPCEGTRLPRKSGDTDHDMRMLTADEFRVLLAATHSPWQLLVEFLVASGMRWGEVAALQPKHVDVRAGTVPVEPGSTGGGIQRGHLCAGGSQHQRVEASREAEAATARQRAAQDAERASARRDAEDAAARRARQAEEDRARYEKRLREYEQEQAGKK